MGASNSSDRGNVISDDITTRLKTAFLLELCTRPASGLTEMRRDGKDNRAVEGVVRAEFKRAYPLMKEKEFVKHMRSYAAATWATLESVHKLQLDDDQPENEKQRLDPDHWYENNLTNASLFANLTLDGLPQLVPGRLFSTRMPRNIVEDPGERQDFLDKCKKNNLKVVCVLTETQEFKQYSGMDGLLDFYRDECGLAVYNRAIPDFQIPTSGDLMNNILDLTLHLAKGENCLIHCAGGSGRTGMVVAAVIKNLGVYDPIARIRRVKSTYVETMEQELFLKNMPKAIDSRIVDYSPSLARAIAAEHLIQVFITHGEKLDQSEHRENIVDQLEEGDTELESQLVGAYCQTFDLVDKDGSGDLDQLELLDWLAMCGAEIDMSKIIDVLTQEGHLSREKFAELMCSSATSSRRDYDIGGPTSSGHH